MKMIPLFKCSNMAASIRFYTEVLDFSLSDPADTAEAPVVDLANGNAWLQLTVVEGISGGSIVNVLVEQIDQLFEKYVQRGLDTSGKSDSPVHEGPIDQTWGRREFYVTDMDGNTLRFYEPIK